MGLGLISVTDLSQKCSNLSRTEILGLFHGCLETFQNAQIGSVTLESENFAFREQVVESEKDFSDVKAELVELRRSHADLIKSRDRWRVLAEMRESELIFLEDHARFSAEQTRLSISHWDLLLRNRDENIELLSTRVAQLTADARLTNDGLSLDKHKCLLERYQALAGLEADQECPWKHQADVRVSQLERVTSQLNSTYDQLHTKSDELLLQNRTVGTLRRRVLELENKVKRRAPRIEDSSD